MREVLFTLPWCQIGLYPIRPGSIDPVTAPFGIADTGAPAFLGTAESDQVSQDGSITTVFSRPSGTQFAFAHGLDYEHRIEIGSAWVTNADAEGGIVDFELDRAKQYILWLAFTEDEQASSANAFWYGRVYYGVTVPNYRIVCGDAVSFMGHKAIQARFYQPRYGNGNIPTVTQTWP